MLVLKCSVLQLDVLIVVLPPGCFSTKCHKISRLLLTSFPLQPINQVFELVILSYHGVEFALLMFNSSISIEPELFEFLFSVACSLL